MQSRVQTKQDIFRALSDHSAELKQLGVRNVGLFGSFVRGEQTAESDIDFLIQFEPDKKTFDNFMNLSGMRDKLIHDYFGVDYDIVWDMAVAKAAQLERDIESILSNESQ